METIVLACISITAVLWGLWFLWSIHTWWLHFSWRLPRSNPSSPSNGQRPLLQPMAEARSMGCPAMAAGPSKNLDMNHVHVSLLQYLWAAHWVAIPAIALVILGWCQIQLAQLLKSSGWLRKPSEVDLRRMIYHLVLENLCTGVTALEDIKGSGRVATFVYSPFPMYVDDGSQVRSEGKTRMVVKLHLGNPDFLSAELDGETLTVTDAAVLLAHYVIVFSHPKMHAYANWGIDPADSSNSYLQKMSVVTACYNHYGWTNFPQMAGNMVHHDAAPSVRSCLQESMTSGVSQHKLVVALADHSPLLKFIIHLRAPFQQAFKKFRKDFPANCSCEAHFLGTVVHSLDHWVFCKTIDPWLFSAIEVPDHLQSLHRTVLLARCCALDDIPTVGIAKHFKDCSTEFHRAVYLAAKDLDLNLANQIQTCIVK